MVAPYLGARGALIPSGVAILDRRPLRARLSIDQLIGRPVSGRPSQLACRFRIRRKHNGTSAGVPAETERR